MSGRLLVLGAGGHAKVVVATALAAGFEVVEILDDDERKWGGVILGVPVNGPITLASEDRAPVVLAIGDNATRKDVSRLPLRWTTVVDPSAVVHDSVSLGEGTVVFAGAVIQPHTSIGAHSIVNTGATVDHDCRLGSYVHIAPGVHLSGGVNLEEGVFMGIGSCAIPGVRVGAWSVVGAGGAVVNDLPAGVTAVGVPARPLVGKGES